MPHFRSEKTRQRDKIREQERRKRENYTVYIPCRKCGIQSPCKKYKEKAHLKKGGIVCISCRAVKSAEIMKNYQSTLTPEERKLHGKQARSQVKNSSEAVTKQWQTIRADPEKMKEICQARSERMKEVWANYDDETKNHIVSSLVQSQNQARSKGSDLLKQQMMENGLYDGFLSEQTFHGFIPDEINHDLKIIVEFYGDVYHCNPKKYTNPSQYLKIIGRTVQEQWDRDRRRLATFYKHGYTVIIVWDKAFRANPQKELQRIKYEIDKKRETLPKI